MRKYILLTTFVLSVGTSLAQQSPYLGLYYANPFSLNPAQAGLSEYTDAYLHYRRQWIGIEGAPETQLATVNWKVPNQPMGLGLSLSRDVSNIFVRSQFMATYAYHLTLKDRHALSFGLSAGAVQNSLLLDQVHADITDPNLYVNNTRSTRFDLNAGMFYSFDKRLEIGFNVQQLTQPAFSYSDEETQHDLTYRLVQHYNATVGYIFSLKEGEYKIKPLVMLRTPQGQQFQFEVGVAGYYRDLLFAGLNYRNGIGYAASAGIDLAKRYRVGYLYEFSSTELAGQSGGSHEFMLGIRFGGTSSGQSKKELKEMERRNAEINERLDILQQENEALKKRVDGLEKLKSEYEQTKTQLDQLKQNQGTQNPPAKTEQKAAQPEGNSNQIRFEYEQGMSADQLDLDDRYPDDQFDFEVIVGSFTGIENAKTLQKILKREYNIDSEVTQDGKSDFYHVRTSKTSSQREALQQAIDAKTLDSKGVINGSPWVNPVEVE